MFCLNRILMIEKVGITIRSAPLQNPRTASPLPEELRIPAVTPPQQEDDRAVLRGGRRRGCSCVSVSPTRLTHLSSVQFSSLTLTQRHYSTPFSSPALPFTTLVFPLMLSGRAEELSVRLQGSRASRSSFAGSVELVDIIFEAERDNPVSANVLCHSPPPPHPSSPKKTTKEKALVTHDSPPLCPSFHQIQHAPVCACSFCTCRPWKWELVPFS